MSSWYSWLPGFPSLNIPLPSGLQGRFVSFVLKKSLGHFLKPDQLDVRQIDSQIGSGYVQVNDVELNNDAINDLLPGLPIFLHDGFMSSITARIPWPNPLTSTLGFSLNNLRLTFHLLPQPNGSSIYHPDITLAESVFSVAESFVHEELNPQEGTQLERSVHSDLAASIHSNNDPEIPGALDVDPFIFSPDEALHVDSDPAGVSLFTNLIERLLARFEFDAVNTEITLVHHGNMSITLSIAEIRYRTEVHTNASDEEFHIAGTRAGVRILSLSGVKITARNLKKEVPGSPLSAPFAYHNSSSVQVPSPTQYNLRPADEGVRTASPASSTSSLDEETQFAMSQSLASLPRPPSPAVSDSSSMYQSAMNTTHAFDSVPDRSVSNGSRTPSPTPIAGIKRILKNEGHYSLQNIPVEEEILTFSTPISVKLTTSPMIDDEMELALPHTSNESKEHGEIQISITCGILACALRGWHIIGLSELATRWTHSLPHEIIQTDPRPLQSTVRFGVKGTLNIRSAIFLLIFPSPGARLGHDFVQNVTLAEFFKRPLVPPSLSQGYVRIHFDDISSSLSATSLSGTTKSQSLPMNKPSPNPTKTSSLALAVNDLSIFSYNIPSSSHSHFTPFISPLMITDHALLSQYSNSHAHPYKSGSGEIYSPLPMFDIIDWTDPRHHHAGVKISSWRTTPSTRSSKAQKPSGETGSYSTSPPGAQHLSQLDERSTPKPVKALSININRQTFPNPHHRQTILPDKVAIKVGPLHTFMDLALLLDRDGVLALIDELRNGINATAGIDDIHSTRHKLSSDNRDAERNRLIKPTVVEDLDQSHRYDSKPIGGIKNPNAPNLGTNISLQLDFLRIQIRCPPPPGRPSRSGAFCVDLHDIKLTNGSILPKRSAHFVDFDSPALKSRTLNDNTLLSIELSRVLIAATAVHERVAKSIISIGPLGSPAHDFDVPPQPIMASPMALKPLVIVGNSRRSPQQNSLSFRINIPSIHVNIDKPVYNALQYWVDDVTQLVDRTFGERNNNKNVEKGNDKDASLIGSRFFAKSRSGSSTEGMSDTNNSPNSEASVQIAISEVFVHMMIPGTNPGPLVRSLIILASDVNTTIEMKVQGRDETTFVINSMDFSVQSDSETFLSLTTRRSLSSAPRSMIRFCFTSLTIPETAAKETRIEATLTGFTFTMIPDPSWITDLAAFVKSPPGTFESVIPSEKTSISLKVLDGSMRSLAPHHPGVLVIHVGDLEFSTDVIGDSPESFFLFRASSLALLFIDNISDQELESEPHNLKHGVTFWKMGGFALLADISALDMDVKHNRAIPPSSSNIKINRLGLKIHLCADSLAAITAFIGDLSSVFNPSGENRPSKPKRRPTIVSKEPTTNYSIMNSIEDLAFQKMPEIGPAPDMINDDLPTNMDYLDASFGAAAGLRELRDDDLDEFSDEADEEERTSLAIPPTSTGIVSKIGGETIKILRPEGIHVTEGYFDDLPPDTDSANISEGEKMLSLRICHADITLLLYEGYDWVRTRKVIEGEVREMRRRLEKIRQLVANGQTQDPIVEDTSALLFNSLYIGLDQNIDDMEPGALLAAIDNELKDDIDVASQSSWQSLKSPVIGKPRHRPTRVHGKRLTRSKAPSMEFCLSGLQAEVDQYIPNEPVVSRTFITVHNLEILDHIKTSTWKKFLTELRSDSHGNIRETNSNMIRVELCTVRPVPDHPSEEARLRAKILPLRLYVDQDAVDFLKKFFSFKDPETAAVSDPKEDADDTYFQLAEVFPIDLKLDYKPRRVDYRALREGKTIELMNFFHFDGAEMTLRHITLAGITGWARFFDLLNDLWTPDVKATQLVEVISGVAPIRSVVNVGSGIADLVLLPIAQYKKDGRIVRGVQKGTTAFVKSTAIEAIKLGARLATGTQVILEQAEGVLGGKKSITAEAVQNITFPDDLPQHKLEGSDDEELVDAISKYAQQPIDLKEGMQSAYKSLQRNFNSAAQTILAVPMEVYERSGNEGPVRSVIRAVPIAVLKPMIGASEAVSQTLLGLHNTLDPNIRHDNEAKYKSH